MLYILYTRELRILGASYSVHKTCPRGTGSPIRTLT